MPTNVTLYLPMYIDGNVIEYCLLVLILRRAHMIFACGARPPGCAPHAGGHQPKKKRLCSSIHHGRPQSQDGPLVLEMNPISSAKNGGCRFSLRLHTPRDRWGMTTWGSIVQNSLPPTLPPSVPPPAPARSAPRFEWGGGHRPVCPPCVRPC